MMFVDARRCASMFVDRRRSARSPRGIGAKSLVTRRLHRSGTPAAHGRRRQAVLANDRKEQVMNKNDDKQVTTIETEPKTDAKPRVRIVDLEEVREVLGAAAAAPSVAAPPVDTTGCSW
jgi:hypothetical protein